MELVVLLICLSVVVATPHGYGVKTGAAAKADASAAAGAFGAIGAVPLSIPSGGSFSGSYSKSSSSSFASASASSSSSSFSISGTGSGPYNGNNVLSGVNGTPGITVGCASNNCLNSDSKEIANTVASLEYNNAKAGATNEAVIGTFSPNPKHGNLEPCSNGLCANKESPGCEGYNCNNKPNKDVSCKQGQCASGVPAAPYDTNDISVTRKTNYNVNNNDKSTGTGSSGSNTAVESVYNKPVVYLTPPKDSSLCTSSQCDFSSGPVYDKNKPSSYNVPIGTYLNPSTESLQPQQQKELCSSENCGNKQLIGSTHVQHPEPEKKDCASGDCGDYPLNPLNIGSFTNIAHTSANSSPYGGKDCSTSECSKESVHSPVSTYYPNPTQTDTKSSAEATAGADAAIGTKPQNPSDIGSVKIPYKGGFGGPLGILTPNGDTSLASVNLKPATIENPSLKPTSCLNENCGQSQYNHNINRPTTPTKPTIPCSSGKCDSPISPSPTYNPTIPSTPFLPGAASVLKPNDKAPADEKIPYKGGFGGPPGLLNPNDDRTSAVLNVKPTTFENPTFKPTPCLYGNCGHEYPKAPIKPSMSTPCLNGICGHESQYNYNVNQPTIPTIPCSSGKCDSPLSPSYTYNPTIPSTPFVPGAAIDLKPNDKAPVAEKIPYKGGFGGPPGLLNPNDDVTGAVYNVKPTTFQNPIVKPTPCLYGNCGHDYPKASIKPSIPCSSGTCGSSIPNIPSTPSVPVIGYPSTDLKLNDKTPPLIFTSNYKPAPQIPPSSPTLCISGICEPSYRPNSSPIESTSSSHIGPYSSYRPTVSGTGILNPPGEPTHINVQYKPAAPTDYHQVSGPVDNFKHCSSGNCASVYTKPPSYSPIPQTVQYTETCAFGKCGTIPNHVPTSSVDNTLQIHSPCSNADCSNSPSQSFPQSSLGIIGNIPSICTSGNCANGQLAPKPQYSVNGISVVAGAAAGSKAVAYTGGFGGPPGLLKPYDIGKLSNSETKGLNNVHGKHIGDSTTSFHPSYGKSINGDGALIFSGAKAQAQSSALAGSSTSLFNSSIQPNNYNNIKSGCQNGCGLNGGSVIGSNGGLFENLGIAGASSKSSARAGSFTQAGSFASSSASAYSAAGASIKGGYGRR